MKIEKNTMATLLLALTIAIAGVIPALAATTHQPLTVTVEPFVELYIELTGDNLIFGKMYVSEVSVTKHFMVTVKGSETATITSEFEEGDVDDFWKTYLTLTCESLTYTIGNTVLPHVRGSYEEYSFSAVLDLTGAPTGDHWDNIIFWLTPS